MSSGVLFENNHGPVTVISEVNTRRSSVIGKLIEIIANADSDKINLNRNPANIDHKIRFNDLKKHIWLIEHYINSCSLIDDSITELNKVILNGSTKLKRQMKIFYMESLAKFNISTSPFDIDRLRLNSDNIVSDVMSQVKSLVNSSSDLQTGYYYEDINYGISLVTSYSIIECIVLENPNDHN